MITAYRYWNGNGFGIAVVAVEGGADDWAAYIGAQPDPATDQQTVLWTRRFGTKLTEEEARGLFGDHPGLAPLQYRS